MWGRGPGEPRSPALPPEASFHAFRVSRRLRRDCENLPVRREKLEPQAAGFRRKTGGASLSRPDIRMPLIFFTTIIFPSGELPAKVILVTLSEAKGLNSSVASLHKRTEGRFARGSVLSCLKLKLSAFLSSGGWVKIKKNLGSSLFSPTFPQKRLDKAAVMGLKRQGLRNFSQFLATDSPCWRSRKSKAPP